MNSIPHVDRLAQVGQSLQQELSASQELAGGWVLRAAKMLVEQMLNAEVEQTLGRASYQRRDDGQAGYRNGYKERAVKTAEGKVQP